MSLSRMMMGGIWEQPVIPGPSEPPVDPSVINKKNVQLIPRSAAQIAAGLDYRAFGHVVDIDSTWAAYIFRCGQGHLVGGEMWGQKYNKITGVWSDAVKIYSTNRDMRDTCAHVMDNGQIVA